MDTKIEVKENDILQVNTIPNILEEKQIAVDISSQKKKRTRKNKKKKKKISGLLDAENNINNNDNSEKEISNNVPLKRESADNVNAKNKPIDVVNDEKQTTEGVDEERNTVDDSHTEEEQDDGERDNETSSVIYEKSMRLACNFGRYLFRCYDIFNHGKSNIPEEAIDLPYDCRILLRGSIGRYKSTDYFNIFHASANLPNRNDNLRIVFRDALILKGNDVTHAEFLRFCALYFLTAYDLKHTAGFDEAPMCAIDAIVDAIMSTKQKKLVGLWYPFD